MKKYLLIIIVLILTQLSYAHHHEKAFVRFPEISPDGTTIAFSYQGDIWTMNLKTMQTQRLTIHEGYESSPRWNESGDKIAFNSNRHGNTDIFVMNANGGQVKRISYYSANDYLSDFFDEQLIFSTDRVYNQIEWDSEIHAVSENGGTPERIMDALGDAASLSPNGKFIAFVIGGCSTAREDYDGPANKQIWVFNTETKEYNQITTFSGNDFNPIWKNNNAFYFISSRNGTYNIFEATVNDNGAKTGTFKELTKFEDFGVRYISTNADGSKICFARKEAVYLLENEKIKELSIAINSEDRFDNIEYKNYSSYMSDYAVSPNGKLTALIFRGEVFVTETKKDNNLTVRITKSAAREKDLAWLNDSTLLFVSDRNGQYDIYQASSADKSQTNIFKSLKHKIERITNTTEDESNLTVSPDGTTIAYLQGRGTLHTAKLENNKLKDKKILRDSWATPFYVSFSPDSKWLAYSYPDLDGNNEIYIQPADNSSAPVNISLHPRNDISPVWSKDGSKLGFLSQRNNNDMDVWFVWLNKADWEKTRQDWKDDDNEEENKKEEGEKKDIIIDFDNIHERIVQVTGLPGNETNLGISGDGEYFYFVSNGNSRNYYKADKDLYKIKWNGESLKALSSNNQRPYGVRTSDDGKHLFFIKNGNLNRLSFESDKIEQLPVKARMTIDHKAERNQIFEEAWRAINNGFYDPNFHGKDWLKLKKAYKHWAMETSTYEDFRYVFNLMLGQINASHMGLRGGSAPQDLQKEKIGKLGIDFEVLKHGVRVQHVLPDSPASKEKSKLNEGDIILAVNGTEITKNINFYSLFINEVNNKVLLKVENKNGQIREVIIRPVQSLRKSRYKDWVEEKKALTEKFSNGRLGYIHIEGMNWHSFERFERELSASANGKEGIVIDVRHNGGGWTTDYLMAVLNVQQHAYCIPRGAAKNLEKEKFKFQNHYPFAERLPLTSYLKPSIALCNRNSYSNAEIFSHAYKTLEIGTLVGEPTFGAVISTGGVGLIDGSFVRLPFRAWYTKGTDKNQENGPAIPDLLIDNQPDSKGKGIDEQLEAAIKELLKQIDSK